jgi:hypothetical protein
VSEARQLELEEHKSTRKRDRPMIAAIDGSEFDSVTVARIGSFRHSTVCRLSLSLSGSTEHAEGSHLLTEGSLLSRSPEAPGALDTVTA